MFNLEKKSLREDLCTVDEYLAGICGQLGLVLYSEVTNDLGLCQSRFELDILDISKNFFTGKVVNHWHRLPREVLEALEGFKRCVGATLDEV